MRYEGKSKSEADFRKLKQHIYCKYTET